MAGELPTYYGSIHGKQARWIFDSGATANFMKRDEAIRLGLPIRRAPPSKIIHSSGEVETSVDRVAAPIKMHPGCVMPMTFIVLDHMTNLDIVIGEKWMRDHSTCIELGAEDTQVHVTLGHRRITLEPGENDWYVGAEHRHFHQFLSMKDLQCAVQGEHYLCHVYSTSTGQIRAMTDDGHDINVDLSDAALLQLHRKQWARQLAKLRTEQPADISPATAKDRDTLPQQYPTVYSSKSYDTRYKDDLAEHEIPLKSGANLPRDEPLRPLSQAKRDALAELIASLLKRGYIEPSASPFAAPVMLVPKPDGSWRLTLDYRAINSVTQLDTYVPPNPAHLYPAMRGAKLFSRVDALDGFWGCPMKQSDKFKTAFKTHMGTYQWTVMPQGLSGSPARYQRFMDHVLRDYSGVWCHVFIDDIILWADDEQQMKERIHLLHQRLAKYSVQLKQSKCAFYLRSCRFLGHIVDAEGLHADADKIRVLTQMPPPSNVQDVRSLMGVANFIRQYVPHIATTLAPIQALLRKGTKFFWSPACQLAMDELIDKLLSAPVLVLPDPARPKAIMTDASNYAMGMVLLQQQPDTKWHPISFASKAMTGYQARQSPTEREFFAISEALSRWGHEVSGQRPLRVFSDHKPLSYLKGRAKLTDQILRKLDKIARLNVDIEYLPADDVGMADWLSRSPADRQALQDAEDKRIQQGLPAHPLLNNAPDIAGAPTTHQHTLAALGAVSASLAEEIKAAQKADANIQDIVNAEKTDDWRSRYKMSHDLLWDIHDGRLRLLLPEGSEHNELKQKLMEEVHDSPVGGHLGIKKTLHRLQRYVYWKRMSEDVQAYVRSCGKCQRVKQAPYKQQGLYWPLPVPASKWSWVSVDLVTGMRTSSRGHDAALVFVDKLTKRTLFVPCRKKLDAEAAAMIYYEQIFRHHGFPLRMVSDRGTQFASELPKALAKLTGTTLNLTTAYRAQADGQSENAIGTLEALVRSYCSELGDDWDRWLPSLEFALNDSVNRSTGYTPFELEYGQSPNSPLAVELGRFEDSGISTDTEKFLQNLQTSIQTARDNLSRNTAATAKFVNRQRKEVSWAVGDLAYIHRDKRTMDHKMQPLWEGPYRVLEVLSPNVVRLQLPGNRHQSVNVDRLKRHLSADDTPWQRAKTVTAHRALTADDGCVEASYEMAGNWLSLMELVETYNAWDMVQRYHQGFGEPNHDHFVGHLCAHEFDDGLFYGRVAIYDPADSRYPYEIIFSDGDRMKRTERQLAAALKLGAKGAPDA